jgi:hypothetical protein
MTVVSLELYCWAQIVACSFAAKTNSRKNEHTFTIHKDSDGEVERPIHKEKEQLINNKFNLMQ